MGFFNNTQSTSLIKNEEALDFEFVPKLLKYREKQQHYVAGCIKPLLENRTGRNLFIYGGPGIGKTAAIKWILRDLEETSEDVVPIYLNCWQKKLCLGCALCFNAGYLSKEKPLLNSSQNTISSCSSRFFDVTSKCF